MPPPAPPPARSPWVSIVLASVVGLFLFAALLLLTGGAAIVGVLAFGFAAVHYLVWGWWLGGIIRREVEEDDADSAEQNGNP